ncbi:MAG: TIGR00180 family glycosyltransferase [Candidatus Omnitrophica bacterium]|nr:TIGR00180 family glycosyltransferase [Candidatus Omnitrophota bacterium]
MNRTPLTIVIPTRNRSAYLRRLLGYFANRNCGHPILIGDSSDPEQLDRDRQTVRLLSQRLRLAHRAYPPRPDAPPGSDTIRCMSDLLLEVDTPYAVNVADDDFVVLEAMDDAVRFLQAHPETSSVHGQGAYFSTLDNAVHGPIRVMGSYAQHSIEDEKPSRRVLAHFKEIQATEFSVKRTPAMASHWQMVLRLGLDNFFGELLVSSLGVIEGKVHQLSRLYLLRQVHPQMTSQRSLGRFDWVVTRDWRRQWEQFRDTLARALQEREGISLEQAQQVMKLAFWSYLVSYLETGWKREYESSLVLWQEPLRHLPLLRQTWGWVRSFIPGGRFGFSLQALLRPTSAYRSDFFPIYRAIREPLLLAPEEGGRREDPLPLVGASG